MGDLASLLPGIASIITALGGVWIGHRALSKGSPKERENAARHAIDRVLGDDDEDNEDDEESRSEARAELLERLQQLLELEDEKGGDS